MAKWNHGADGGVHGGGGPGDSGHGNDGRESAAGASSDGCNGSGTSVLSGALGGAETALRGHGQLLRLLLAASPAALARCVAHFESEELRGGLCRPGLLGQLRLADHRAALRLNLRSIDDLAAAAQAFRAVLLD